MAITLPGGFSITNNEAVDSRISVADQSARLGFSAANVYEGLLVYQQDTDEIYVLTDASDPSDNTNWTKVYPSSAGSEYSSSMIGSSSIELGTTASSLEGLELISATTGTFTLTVYESSSTIIHSGSNVFGDEETDTQQFTGSILTTGSVEITGSLYVSDTVEFSDAIGTGSFTGSFTGSNYSTDFTFSGDTLNVLGDVYVQGTLDAATKNFKIDHPTMEGYYLVHSSLEGPERGIYHRGKLKTSDVIHLPDYWKDLPVDDTDITVQLTPIGNACHHFVKSVTREKIEVGCECGKPHCFYIVHAQRYNEGKFEILEPKRNKNL